MNQPVYSSRDQGRVARIIPDLVRSRELIAGLVWKDLRAQYRYAVMGFLWAVIEPLMMTLVLTLVFTIILPLRMGEGRIEGDRPFAVLLLCAYLFWKFFADSLSSASRSLVDNRTLVNKVNFPREAIPLASVGFCAVNLAIGFAIFIVVAALFGIWPSVHYVWLPLVFGIQLGMVVGLALLLSALNATYRDVSYIIGVGLIFGFYATPIFYDLDIVRRIAVDRGMEWIVTVFHLNPMVGIVTSLREILVWQNPPDPASLLWPAAFAAASIATGVIFFRKRSGTLADHL